MALMLRSDDPALEFLAHPDDEPTLSDFASFLRSVGEITMLPRLPNGGAFPGWQSFHPSQLLPKSMDFISYNGLTDRFAAILASRDVDAADAFRVAVLGDDWELRYEYLEDGCHLQGRCAWKPGSPWIDTGLAPEDEALASLSFTCQMIAEAQAMRFGTKHEFIRWMDAQQNLSADMAMRLMPYQRFDYSEVQTIEWILREGNMAGATGCLRDLPGDWSVDALTWEPEGGGGNGLWTCRVVRRAKGKGREHEMAVTSQPKVDPAHAVLTCAMLAWDEISRMDEEARRKAFGARFHFAYVGGMPLLVPK
jgi:hypothetical protein